MSTGPVISLANFPMGSGPCEGKTLPIMSTIEEMSPFPSYSASGALADSPFPCNEPTEAKHHHVA